MVLFNRLAARPWPYAYGPQICAAFRIYQERSITPETIRRWFSVELGLRIEKEKWPVSRIDTGQTDLFVRNSTGIG
jgi:hypothetical protein